MSENPKSRSTSKQIRVAEGIYKYGVGSNLFSAVYRERGKQVWLRGFATLAEARQARNQALADISRGKHVRPSKETVESFYRTWEEGTRPQMRETSARTRAQGFRDNILPYFGERRLQDVRPEDIAAWHATLLRGVGRLGSSQRPLSPTTVNRHHRELNTMLKDAVRWGKLAVNPCSLVKAPPAAHVEMRTWTPEQVGLFFAHLGEHAPGWLPMFVLAATSGARRGEVVAVQWRDLDLSPAGGVWRVRRSIVTTDGVTFENDPKTKSGWRTIHLDATTTAALRAHRARVAEAALAEGRTDALAEESRVFPAWHLVRKYRERVSVVATRFGCVAPATLSEKFKHLAADTGLPQIRFHDLRHSWATAALSVGMNPKTVAERLGHANVAMTLRVYSHVSEQVHREAAEQVSGLMFGGPAVAGEPGS